MRSARYTLEEIQADRAAFNVKLTSVCGEALNGYGVCILQVQLTEFAPAARSRLNTHGAIGQYTMWTGFLKHASGRALRHGTLTMQCRSREVTCSPERTLVMSEGKMGAGSH